MNNYKQHIKEWDDFKIKVYPKFVDEFEVIVDILSNVDRDTRIGILGRLISRENYHRGITKVIIPVGYTGTNVHSYERENAFGDTFYANVMEISNKKIFKWLKMLKRFNSECEDDDCNTCKGKSLLKKVKAYH